MYQELLEMALVRGRLAGGLFQRRSSIIVACVILTMLVALSAAKIFWRVRTPLLIFLGGTWAVWSLVFWICDFWSSRSDIFRLLLLIVAWSGGSVLCLGGVYEIDRAGWLWFRLTGCDVTLPEDRSDLAEISTSDFIQRYPFFTTDPNDCSRLLLKKGRHDIGETIVVPRGTCLRIEPGAVLCFEAGRSLVSYSPIVARGTDQEPIVFTARNKWLKWGVVGVVNTEKSVFEHVRVEYGRHATVNNIHFPATLTMIGAEVEIAHSEFRNLFGKDAVNIQHGQVLIHDNVFRNTYKDGLDLDGGAGQVSQNVFINCGDEGIDLSENENLRVFQNEIADWRGGRISADTNLVDIRSANVLHYCPRNSSFLWFN